MRKVNMTLLLSIFYIFNSYTSAFCISLNDNEDRKKVSVLTQDKEWGDNCIIRKGEELYRITAMLSNRNDRDEKYVTHLATKSNPGKFLSKNVIIERIRVEDQDFVNRLAHKGVACSEVYWNVTRKGKSVKVPHVTYLIQHVGMFSDFYTNPDAKV